MTQEELIEELAAQQHENWKHWMKIWFFTRCVDNLDGSVTVPDHLVMQWKNHVMHSYADMADSAREPYRAIATHILSVIEAQSPDEEIVKRIQEAVKRIPSLYDSELEASFQDRHIAMQTYLMARMLEEIEGIHNGFFVLYNERQKGQDEARGTD